MSRSRSSAEPFVWLGFSAGGVVAALVIPALLFLFGVAFPLGWLDPPSHAHLLGLLTNPLTRIALLGIAVLALVHAAHRLRFVLVDGLGLRRYDPLVATGSYGLAAAGALVAGYLLLIAV